MPAPEARRVASQRSHRTEQSSPRRARPSVDAPSPLLGLQSTVGNEALGGLLRQGLLQAPPPPVAQRRCHCQDDDRLESSSAEADREAAPPAAGPDEPSSGDAPAEGAPSAAVVVEDDAPDVSAGQMRKSEFLARLRPAVIAAADAGVSDKSRAGQASAFVDRWVGAYESKNAEQINDGLSRLVTDQPPTTADGYITAVAERVRTGVATWESTGEMPPELTLFSADLPALGAFGGGLLGGLGGAIFGARARGLDDLRDPMALQSRLGAGQPLHSGVRSRMESAFGRSFAHVRIHTDSAAAGLSTTFNAKAFAVGSHVAFGPREYRPGTAIGDVLIAHELAHVAQQGNAGAGAALGEGQAYRALERDADLATAGAVVSMWSGLRGRLKSFPAPQPQLTSGLRLQRCEGCNCNGKQAAAPLQGPTTPQQPAAPTGPAACEPTPTPYQTLVTESGKEGTLGITKLDQAAQIMCLPRFAPGAAAGTCSVSPMPLNLALISKSVAAGDHPTGRRQQVPGCAAPSPAIVRISPDMARKAKIAEQEHCADHKVAFDRTLKPCQDAIARLAGTPVAGRNDDECFADMVRKLGFDPIDCSEEFVRLVGATGLRDTQDWHTFNLERTSATCTEIVYEPKPIAETKVGVVPAESHVPAATKCGSGAAARQPQAAPSAPPPQPPPRP